MDEISLADAKANLSKVIDQVVSGGGGVQITRRGKPVAQLTAVPPPRKRINAEVLRALTATMTPQEQSAGDFVREMRDGDRS